MAERPLYARFAPFYDILLPRFDPGVVAFARQCFDRYGKRDAIRILDLGCGTGSYTIALAEVGYGVVGVDLATKMLAVTKDKARQRGLALPLVQADARALGFDRCFDVCLCRGVLNDLVGQGQVATALHSVAAILADGALFLFDVRESAAHARRYATQPEGEIKIEGEGLVFRHRARFDPRTRIISVFEEFELEGSSQRDSCLWQMRTFTPIEVRAMLAASGFTVRAMLGWYDFEKELGSTDRITVVAQWGAGR
ncbi:MAG: class I SAM-dependent methyltransferase [Anaerolineae bacterium]